MLYVAKSCQKDVVSNDYYQKMEIDINNGLVGKQDLEFCIQHRYHYSSIIYQFPWLNSAGEIMAGYPASVFIKNLAAFPYNVNIGLIDCLASQDASSRECETTYSSIGIVGENKIMIYVCPSCFLV